MQLKKYVSSSKPPGTNRLSFLRNGVSGGVMKLWIIIIIIIIIITYLLTYLHTYLLTYFLACLLTYILTWGARWCSG